MKWIIERDDDNEIVRRKLEGTNITIERKPKLFSNVFYNDLCVDGESYEKQSGTEKLDELKELGEKLARSVTQKEETNTKNIMDEFAKANLGVNCQSGEQARVFLKICNKHRMKLNEEGTETGYEYFKGVTCYSSLNGNSESLYISDAYRFINDFANLRVITFYEFLNEYLDI